MTEKAGYKYSIKFNQSLTSGTLAFEGYFAFDEFSEYDPNKLLIMLENTEKVFQNAGYKVASIIPNNMKDMENKNKK